MTGVVKLVITGLTPPPKRRDGTDEYLEGLPMDVLTGFRNSPDGGKGLARDFRVRWALEELGQPFRDEPRLFRRS